MKTRYSFGGDEHLVGEVDEEMSLEAFFKVLLITNIVRAQAIEGLREVCPANASYMVKFDPDVISPAGMLKQLHEIERSVGEADQRIDTRIIELPVYYKDPWTRETLMRFRDRHQDPNSTDLEYAARINGFESDDGFVDAHAGSPWFVTMIGFAAGLPWLYQLVERRRQLQVPKYIRPRTDTPKQTIGYGGCFTAIYSVRGAGGYQMFGITPVPIFDPRQEVRHLRDSMVFFNPGDIVKFRSIGRSEYDRILDEVEAGKHMPIVKTVTFSLDEWQRDIEGYNRKTLEVLYGG
ncbi:MAG: carboxyltransferase domain-containing protein [Gammaproteobacteria bacterium]|nr:carboxyltransferase domain-containing protein [Gammaproteobacteria bacterium]MDE0285683.1 carboxyltransferase domain-containing protein [Gammaproteobacteria bacterium]MDE0511106.1 carboxyltransferase domain-containing protein [Gammaproteobacteria bacterium]